MSNYFVHDADLRRVKKHFAYFLSINSGYKLKCHKVSSVQGSAGEIFVKVMAKVVCNARRFMVTIFIVIVISKSNTLKTFINMSILLRKNLVECCRKCISIHVFSVYREL